MADKSGIAWTDATWNPVTGCTPVSGACKNCYARTMTKRLQAMGQEKYAQGFDKVVCHDDPKLLSQPARWTRPRRIFVNSMSDTFHRDVPFEFIDKIYKAMFDGPQHMYQVLTKRPAIMYDYIRSAPFDLRENMWHGVTVEGFATINRIDYLQANRCLFGKFVSFEPLLDSVKGVALNGIDWVIIGGESGPGARPMHPSWVKEIIEEARKCGCAIFVKQMGAQWASYADYEGDRTRKGDNPEQWPSWAQIQEFPYPTWPERGIY